MARAWAGGDTRGLKMSRRTPPTVGPRVHERGNKRLDGVLDFVAFAARPMPLLTLLDEAPRRIVSLLEAEVCSLYLLEGDKSELVMRGNVGLSNAAIGQVRLRVGQGITGESIEYMRPISTETAEQHAAYKHFAGIGEERFPVFLAVPFRGKAGPLGAVVVQRGTVPFTEADIELLALIGGLIAAGSRHAELVDEARERRARKLGGGTRKVTLAGRPVVVGRALGAVAALRRPPRSPGERPSRPGAADADADVRRLRGAFDVAEKAILGLRQRARDIGLAADAQFLATYVEILEDMRFRERATELVADGDGVAQALSKVARAVTRAAASVTRDAFLEERARDVEDLCDALTMLADTDRRSALPSKAVLLGDTLTVFDLLVSARSLPSGIALTERASGPRTRVLLKLMNIPAVADVKGLFRWAADGDIALLDGDHGLFIINPSKSEVASLREDRRAQDPARQKSERDGSREGKGATRAPVSR
jgi:phosphotransferase system enzyme I (PtsP)